MRCLGRSTASEHREADRLPNSSASELSRETWDYPVRNYLRAFDWNAEPVRLWDCSSSGNGTRYVARIFHVKPSGINCGGAAMRSLVAQMGILGLILFRLR